MRTSFLHYSLRKQSKELIMKHLIFYCALLFCSMSLASIRRENLRDNNGKQINANAQYSVFIITKDMITRNEFNCDGVTLARSLEDFHDDDLISIQKISLLSRFNCISRNSVQFQQIKTIRRNDNQR